MNYDDSLALRAPSLSEGVRKTLFNTFVTVGAMMAITGLAGYFSLGVKLGLWPMLGLFATSIAVLFATMLCRNSPFGLVLLAVFGGIEGVVLGPLLNHYLKMQGGAALVASAGGMTALAAFACATYAISTKRDFSRLRGFLFISTIVLLVASIAALFIPLPGLHVAISGVTAVLFTAWLLYDIGSIVNGTETNYISAALSIYLDLLNIFLSLLRIVDFFGGSGSSDD